MTSVAHQAAAVVAPACLAAPEPVGENLNVLWFIADALRYDYARKLHFLREWAQGGVTFDNHFAMSHCSDPNFLSLLTGNEPDKHGVYTQLEADLDHGPYAGFQVYLRICHGHRALMFGPTSPSIYRWGFDAAIAAGRKDKTESLEAVKAFCDESLSMDKPWFVFLRTMDCHSPYWGGAYRRATRYTDKLLSQLLPWVERNHPDTVVCVFSDHGESLGEHGMRGHLSTLYDVLLHTPMYMKWPDCPQGLHVDAYTRHVDVPPTMARLLGSYKAEHWPGRDMVAVATGEDPGWKLMHFAGDGSFRETYWNWRAVRDSRYKYMAATHISEGVKFYLFDIQQDKRETRNLADELAHRATLYHYADLLCQKYEDWPHPSNAEEWEAPYTEEEAEKVLARLRRLGYT